MIPIHIDPFFWLMAGALGWLNSRSLEGTLVWIVIILVSVLVHEMGHALTARFFGQKSAITLTVYGGVTTRTSLPLSPMKEFLIVLNGPLAGFCLYFLASGIEATSLFQSVPSFQYAIIVTAYVNLFWTLLNLLPIQPLDGGHLLLIASRFFFGLKGVKGAYFLSTALSAILVGVLILNGSLIGGAIFTLFAFESYRAYKESQKLTLEDEDIALQSLFRRGLRLVQDNNLSEAMPILEKVQKESGNGAIHLKSSEKLAEVYEAQGSNEAALSLLSPLRDSLSIDSLKRLQRLYFSVKRYQEAVDVGEGIHKEEADKDVALLNAYSYAALKEVKPGLGWLKTAVREGAEEEPEFAEELKALQESQDLKKGSKQS